MKREEFVAKFLPFLRPVAGMIYDEIQAVSPMSGNNTNVSDAKGGGRVIDAKFTPPQASELYALKLVPVGDEDNPGNVRIVNATLGGLLPSEMNVPDGMLSDGTDNTCYLTMSEGGNYVYGKVAVDTDTGLFTGADVYVTGEVEQPDGDFAYLLIGYVHWDGSSQITQEDISQIAYGSQSLLAAYSADGTLIQGNFSSQGVPILF